MEEHVNCLYCGIKMIADVAFCSRCGAPNHSEPLPWYLGFPNRIKTAFSAKTKDSVWADRLVSLMPIHFILALITLILAFTIGTTPPRFVVISSVCSLLTILVFYPGWYKISPEKRKDDGVSYFIVLTAYILTTISWI